MRILLIDDEPDIRAVAQMSLELVGGYQVTPADSADAAVAIATHQIPDVILLDVMMPVVDGIATFAKLKSLPPISRVPIIFMTAKVQPKEVAYYRSIGAAGVVQKPFQPLTLSTTIADLVECHARAYFPKSKYGVEQ